MISTMFASASLLFSNLWMIFSIPSSVIAQLLPFFPMQGCINDTMRGVLQGITRRLDVPHVFYDAVTGKPYQDVKRSFNTALRRAGIRDFHFHDLRHTFASHLFMAGVDLTKVSRLLGHKTLTMTLRYAHLAPSHMVKAVDLLDSALTEKPTIQKVYNQAGLK